MCRGRGRPAGRDAPGAQRPRRVGCRARGGVPRRAGGGVGAGGGGAGWAAAPAPLQPLPLGRGGRGARRRELGHCGSRSPRLRCASAPGAPCRRCRRCCRQPGFPSFGSQGKARGVGLEAASLPDPGCAGRQRRSAGSRQQPGGGLTGWGIAAVRTSHLQPQRPVPGSAELGFPSAGAACAEGRSVLRENGTRSPPGQQEGCESGQGRIGKVASRPRVSVAGPGARSALGRASAWRGPALCQPRAAGTRTHPCRRGHPGASLPPPWGRRRGRGERGRSAPGVVPLWDPACGLGGELRAWARAPVISGLTE